MPTGGAGVPVIRFKFSYVMLDTACFEEKAFRFRLPT